MTIPNQMQQDWNNYFSDQTNMGKELEWGGGTLKKLDNGIAVYNSPRGSNVLRAGDDLSAVAGNNPAILNTWNKQYGYVPPESGAGYSFAPGALNGPINNNIQNGMPVAQQPQQYQNKTMFGGMPQPRQQYGGSPPTGTTNAMTGYTPYQPYQGQQRTSGMFGAPVPNTTNTGNNPWAGSMGWSQNNPWSTR